MDILFINEIADELRVGRTTVYSMFKTGLNKYTFRVGKRQAIQRKDLQNYIDSLKGK